MNKKFSLLSATYNNEKYLKSWAKSILYQDYRPIEVIVVDDDSSDNTMGIINSLAAKFEEADIDLKIIENEKRVCYASSLKIAMNNASGYYFGVLDTDDMLAKSACSTISKIYDDHPEVAWIYTQFKMFDEKMKFRRKGFSSFPKKESLLDMGKRRKHGASHWRTWSSRVPCLDKLFVDGQISSIDKYMWYILEENCQGMFVDKVCYNYRGGVPGCISKVGNAIAQWKIVIQEADERRKQNNITPIPIMKYKGL